MMEQPSYQIATIKNRFVIMQNYQSFATFRIENNGGLTVSYHLAYKSLDIKEKIALNLKIEQFLESEENK